jgi:flagellar motor switch protein FliN/FliY
MANILSQEELDALLKEMKQLREEESKDSDVHLSSPSHSSTPIGSFRNDMANQQNEVNLEVTLNLPIKLTAELGRARLSVFEILQLTQGSMIELDNKAKAPLRLMIKSQRLAHGEVVVKEEKFALRITDVFESVREEITKYDN